MRRWAAAAVVATLVVATGCGGGDSDGSADTAASATSGTDAGNSSDTSEGGTGDGGTGSGTGGSYCDTVSRTMGDFTAVESADQESMFDPSSFEAMFGGVLEALDAMEAVAPDEIADDFAVLSTNYRSVIEVFEAADWDIMSLMSDPEANAALEVLDSAEVTAAADNIEAYTLEACGIDLGETGGDDTTGDTMAPADTMAPGGTGTGSGDPAVDMAASLLKSMFGLTDEQALCLADLSSQAGIDASDVTSLTPILDECGIPLEVFMDGAAG